MSTITVTSDAETGPNTLYQAILDANANPAITEIVIDINTVNEITFGFAVTTVIPIDTSVIIRSNATNQGSRPYILKSNVFSNATLFQIPIGNAVTFDSIIFDLSSTGTPTRAIECINSSLTTTNCWFNNCQSATIEGGAILVRASSTFNMNGNCQVSNCISNAGAGIACIVASTGGVLNATIEDTVFINNTASSVGGAAYLYSSNEAELNFSTNNCLFSGNLVTGASPTTKSGGAMRVITDNTASANVNVSNTVFERNRVGTTPATNFAGVISIDAFNASNLGIELNKVTITESTAPGSTGVLHSIAQNSTCVVEVIDSTISNNQAAGTAAFSFINNTNGTTNATFRNSTVSGNRATNTAGRSISVTTGIGTSNVILYNTIVANTTNADGTATRSDLVGSFSTTSANNLIGAASASLTGITDGVNGNIVGTLASPVDPLLSALANNGSAFVPIPPFTGTTMDTMALNAGSPAINTGDNAFVVSATDQTNNPRIVGGTVDMGAYEYRSIIPCFDGKSKVYTRHIETGIISHVNAEEVYAGEYEVFNVITKEFTPVVRSTFSAGAEYIMLIKKDTYGPGKPFEDFYVTSGHKLWINNEEIKARDIKEAIKLKIPPQKVYSITTKDWIPISINGLDVFSWCDEQWLTNSKLYKFGWSENKKLIE